MKSNFLAKVKFFRFWLITMDYSPWFNFQEPKKSMTKVYRLKGNGRINLMAPVSVAYIAPLSWEL